MPSKPSQPGPTGPRLRKCRTCGEFEVSSSLIHGECPECAGLLALPLRGAGGRFLTFTRHQTSGGGEGR